MNNVNSSDCLVTSYHEVCIQLFRERLSEKVHATIPKGIVGGFEFIVLQRHLREWHERLIDVCLRVLKEIGRAHV